MQPQRGMLRLHRLSHHPYSSSPTASRFVPLRNWAEKRSSVVLVSYFLR